MKFFVPLRPLLKGWLFSFVAWGLVALTMTLNSVAAGRESWTGNVRPSIRDWLAWAVLTPLVFRFVSRFPIEQKTWRRVLPLHLICAVVVVATVHAWKEMIDPSLVGPHGFGPGSPADQFHGNRPPPPPRFLDMLQVFSLEVPIYLMLVSTAHTLHFYRRSQVRAGELARARLQALQTQLRPHFLFNTLNTIAGLVHKAPDKAESVVQMLSDLLRFSLKANPEAEISLRDEIEFAEKYLAIMHVRFDDRVRYELQISPNALAASIPTLLLQPIIENAIKYGLESKPEGGKITIRGWCDTNFLYLQVTDTGVGILAPDKLREGVGLTSTRARLREFYGETASLKIQSDGGTAVLITIPIRQANETAHNHL